MLQQLRPRALPRWTNDFLSLLPLCKNRHEMRALNSVLITHGLFYEYHPVIINFVDRCCNLGFPDLALSAFEAAKKPSVSLQNALIKSLCDAGLFEDSVSVYRRCRGHGVVSDGYTYPFVIKACAVLNCVGFGNMVHCLVFRTGFVGNIVVQTSLVDFYSKVGDMKGARNVFDEIPLPDSVAWNALISGCCVNGFDRKALETFCKMRVDGVKPNAVTLASVFSVCSRYGNCDSGVALHGLAHKLGYAEDSSLAPSMISLYANRGNLSAARLIFSNSTAVNLAIYNAMISSYTRNHSPENAVEVFRLMLEDGLRPNVVTFLCLIPSSLQLGEIYHLESFHGCVIKSKLEKELSLVTSLLSAYAKLDDIESASILFRDIQVRGLLLWNSMVSAYANCGQWKESLHAFLAMQIDGVNPDSVSVISLLTSCSRLKSLLPGKAAHGFSLKRGIDRNLKASNAFLAFYCNCEDGFVYAFRIFTQMDTRDVVSWNIMISACIDHGDSDTSMLLFHEMGREGIKFDLVTLISILPSCHELNNFMLGLTIHGHAIKMDLKADISLSNALISMYVNSGEVKSARFVFEDMPRQSVVSWNAILTGYRCYKLPNEALGLFFRMMKDGNERPDYLTLANILPCCFLLQGKSIQGYSLRARIPLETPLLTSLITMYGRHKDLRSFLMLFEKNGDQRSISTWNALLSACLSSENYTIAFVVFKKLLKSNLDPDEVTILNVIATCLQLNNMKITDSVMAFLTKAGFDVDVAVSNALINLYAKCGGISDSRAIFDSLQHKDEISWSTMINAYGLHGRGESALALYSQMRTEGLKPDKATYLSILSSCSHSGLVEKGRTILKDMMLEEGTLPISLEHYSCVVHLLGRKGHLNEAYDIVKRLVPVGGTGCGNVLESLLGACFYHGDYGLGEEVGRLVLEMDPEGSGGLVMVHNVYAAAGKWRDAENVRLVMEQRRLSKELGVSFL